MSAPPANPRRRLLAEQAQQLLVGEWYQRTTDRTIWQLKDHFPYEGRVKLAPSWPGEVRTVTYEELARLFRKVSS